MFLPESHEPEIHGRHTGMAHHRDSFIGGLKVGRLAIAICTKGSSCNVHNIV